LPNVAAGRLDAAWGIKLQEWEMQAPLFIAKESGCLLQALNGSPKPRKRQRIYVQPPRLFKVLLPIFGSKHL